MNKVQKKNMIEKYLVNDIAMIDKKKSNMRWNILCDYILFHWDIIKAYIMGSK